MEKLLVEFARHIDRDRFDLRFLTLGERGTLANDIEAAGWPVIALNAPPGCQFGLVPRLARWFRRWDVDIVHTHNTKPLIHAAPAARLAGVPAVVHTRHGQRHGAGWRVNLLFRTASWCVDRFVSVSDDAANLSAREGISAQKIRRIWNGIDVDRFAYHGPCIGGPAVMVGRLSPEKDVATLVQAAERILRDEPDFQLEIAGDGPCRLQIQRLVDNRNLGSRVRLLGEVRDIPALLARASLFVLPSLTEGVSLTLLEAMARGLPVVATRVGGNPEIVLEERTGALVPPHDHQALADAILDLVRHPERGRKLGRAGRQRVVRIFDVRRMIEDYEILYLEILQPQRVSLQSAATPRPLPPRTIP